MKTSNYPDFPKVFPIIFLFYIPEYVREYAFSKNTDSIKCAKTSQLYLYIHIIHSHLLYLPLINSFQQSIDIQFE
jgi:hypothetical protein